MRQKRFLIYLLCQVIVLVGVILIFKRADDVKAASVEAGALFVLSPLILGLKEFSIAKFRRKIFYFGVLQFWVFFALPILGLRLTHWEANFNDLSFLGIPGTTMHQWATPSYGLMMVCTALCYLRREKVRVETSAAPTTNPA